MDSLQKVKYSLAESLLRYFNGIPQLVHLSGEMPLLKRGDPKYLAIERDRRRSIALN